MLLRLYLLYENSPKKCRKLEDISSGLSQCLSLDSEDGGTKPIRASGLHWVAHKWNAMKRILWKYGAYTSHLAALSEDPSVRTADRAKLKGYYNKWMDSKYVLGCAIFVDVPSPCVILSKVMQYDHLTPLCSSLKSIKEIDKLSSTPTTQWSTYASTISKCSTNDTNTVYQTQNLKCYDEAKSYFTMHIALRSVTVLSHGLHGLTLSYLEILFLCLLLRGGKRLLIMMKIWEQSTNWQSILKFLWKKPTQRWMKSTQSLNAY